MFPRILIRALRLRCPRCGQGKLFAGYFKTNTHCQGCGLKFERESGFFLGAIYINYGLTAMVVTVTFLVLTLGQLVPRNTAVWGTTAFAILFPIWFFRYSRSLWLGFDFLVDPQPLTEEPKKEST